MSWLDLWTRRMIATRGEAMVMSGYVRTGGLPRRSSNGWSASPQLAGIHGFHLASFSSTHFLPASSADMFWLVM